MAVSRPLRYALKPTHAQINETFESSPLKRRQRGHVPSATGRGDLDRNALSLAIATLDDGVVGSMRLELHLPLIKPPMRRMNLRSPEPAIGVPTYEQPLGVGKIFPFSRNPGVIHG
jgi:hypothetical protein